MDKSNNKNISHLDDYATNKYALKFIFQLFLLVLLVWVLNIFNIFIIDKDIMNSATLGCAIITGIGYLGHFVVGYERAYAKYYYLIVLYVMITYVTVFLTYHVVIPLLFPMIFSLQYRRRSFTIFSYILTVISIIISTVLGHQVGLCDANMLLLTDTTVENQIQIFEAGPLVYNKDIITLIVYYALPRCLIVLFSVPLLNHIANSITEKALREIQNKKMAETDGLI